MPIFETSILLPRPVEELFDFFVQTANIPRLAPPEAQLQLTDGPEIAQLDAKITLKTVRMGVPQQMTVEVTEFRSNELIVYSQRKGPLKKWVHLQKFVEAGDDTEIHDSIDFLPPGGLLGLMVTADMIEKELQTNFDFRTEKLRELFACP